MLCWIKPQPRTPAVSPGSDGKVLFSAAEKGDLSKVKKLIEGGYNLNIKDEKGNTALMAAAYGGHIHVIELLLNKGADVNMKDNGGVTALMLAAMEGHTEVVRTLIEKGADVNAKNIKGNPTGRGMIFPEMRHFTVSRIL